MKTKDFSSWKFILTPEEYKAFADIEEVLCNMMKIIADENRGSVLYHQIDELDSNLRCLEEQMCEVESTERIEFQPVKEEKFTIDFKF